jgi:hypothetical protein
MVPPNVELVGLAVDVVVGDPWDFTSLNGSVRFPARVTNAATYASGADEERLVIAFLEEVAWHSNCYRFFVARHRHGHGLADDLLSGRDVECSLVPVPKERLSSSDPFDTSWWRGGLALGATLEPQL